jgi:hypothetical protein
MKANIDEKLHSNERQYNNLNKKLDVLKNKKQPYNKPFNTNVKQETRFYERVNNLSQLNFTKEELNILNYGFQYSIENSITASLLNIAIETENAIKLLDINPTERLSCYDGQKTQTDYERMYIF